jgi:AraC-like DNA-binding protein/ligand-binding sensor protein
MNSNKNLIGELADSSLFHDYEKAFSTATGMPVALRPLETFDLPFHGKKMENSFCALVSKKSRSCAGCLTVQQKLRENAAGTISTIKCGYGLTEAAVPLRLGADLIGYLQTGQVLTETPTALKIEKVMERAKSMGIDTPVQELRAAYLGTTRIDQNKLNSTLQLLSIFADFLSLKSNEIVVKNAHAEHPVVTKAKSFIEENHTEAMSLSQVARSVHVSPFHLCKLFRKSTGMTFTEFVSRTRTEKAKSLLLNPQLRISEIVYDVGFQSLTHFNRIFKKLVGESPTQFRNRAASSRSGTGKIAHCNRPRPTARMQPVLA